MIAVPTSEHERLVAWRDYLRALIRAAPEVRPELIAEAVVRLGDRTEQLYPEIENGGRVMLSLEDMDISDPGLTPEDCQHLLQETGALLFAGLDGPRATAMQMTHEIRDIANDERGVS